MTPQQIVTLARLLFGSRYATDTARALGVSRECVVRWAKGDWSPAPAKVEALKAIAAQRVTDIRKAMR